MYNLDRAMAPVCILATTLCSTDFILLYASYKTVCWCIINLQNSLYLRRQCQKNKDTKKCFKIICMVHTCTIDVHHCTQYNLFWSITIKNCFNSGCLQCSYSVVYFMHNAKAQGMIFCLTHLGNKTKLISAKMFFSLQATRSSGISILEQHNF